MFSDWLDYNLCSQNPLQVLLIRLYYLCIDCYFLVLVSYIHMFAKIQIGLVHHVFSVPHMSFIPAIISSLSCLLFSIFRSKIVMEDANQSGFKLPPEFQEDARAPLIELNSTDSTELWLIQWPKDQIPDFDGQQLLLDLHQHDGHLGTVEGSSGKSYDVVSLATQEPKATVFLSAAADSKVVGKITRRVSFVHYMEPGEVPKDDTKKLKQLYEMSSFATSLTNSANHFATPTKSTRSRHLSHSSGHKSSLSEEKVRSTDSRPSSRSSLDSGSRGHEPVDLVSEHSQEKKAKKAKKRKKHVA
ncbi:uncharacterized protein LOC112509000 isoform X2 [Cynara cardunculus var. scolymus]|uniref:uncharacterized protein LOC112509000 isoform X2 n=1 Tax=Cynara cardunculus var. scolymus TaxID=59895 RepID=UPI000D62C3B5|nr:uncharacterized protein LOC112509000 isoform X2 [Cynara cardunculus var. scolymus]